MDDWLAGHIRTATGSGPDSRNARARTCPKCHRWTLTGLSGDYAAFHVRVDPRPLSPAGEALARLSGRYTYALRLERGRYRLWSRDHWQIAGRPAGSEGVPKADVLADHVCQAEALPTMRSVFQTTKRKAANVCPY